MTYDQVLIYLNRYHNEVHHLHQLVYREKPYSINRLNQDITTNIERSAPKTSRRLFKARVVSGFLTILLKRIVLIIRFLNFHLFKYRKALKHKFHMDSQLVWEKRVPVWGGKKILTPIEKFTPLSKISNKWIKFLRKQIHYSWVRFNTLPNQVLGFSSKRRLSYAIKKIIYNVEHLVNVSKFQITHKKLFRYFFNQLKKRSRKRIDYDYSTRLGHETLIYSAPAKFYKKTIQSIYLNNYTHELNYRFIQRYQKYLMLQFPKTNILHNLPFHGFIFYGRFHPRRLKKMKEVDRMNAFRDPILRDKLKNNQNKWVPRKKINKNDIMQIPAYFALLEKFKTNWFFLKLIQLRMLFYIDRKIMKNIYSIISNYIYLYNERLIKLSEKLEIKKEKKNIKVDQINDIKNEVYKKLNLKIH